MRRLTLLAVALILCSAPSLAGEFLINEGIAYGVRVTFSEPVTITRFGDVLPLVYPDGETTEFLFYGATLPAWVGHWIIWEPTSARILNYVWLSTTPEDPTQGGAEEPDVNEPGEEPLPDAQPAPDGGTPDATPPADVSIDPSTITPPDWSSIPYVLSYDPGHNDLRTVYRSGQEVSLDQATRWGLAGSEIKGLKIAYVDEGAFLRLETWSATIQGSYDYGVSFRPQSTNYESFEITVDPIDEDVSASTETDLDLTAAVALVAIDDTSLVLFVEDVLLPGGASILSTERLWTRAILAHTRDGVPAESYELEPYVDFET